MNTIKVSYKDGLTTCHDYDEELLLALIHSSNNYFAHGYNSTNYPCKIELY